MKAFMDENFLLENKAAEELYHGYAKDMPIIDYHCHLSPAEIASDRIFETWQRYG
jgi:glucuronate isomerase